jgi:hypothetical protein
LRRNSLGGVEVKNLIFLLVFLFIFIGTPSQTLIAGSQDGTDPYIVKSKFELPLNIDEINEQWMILGYNSCQIEGKNKGWTSDRPERHNGEHTHAWYVLFAGKMGEMEFIIQNQRFVLEPGDELYYPKDAVIAAKNLHDGRSEWFACWKYF